MSTAALNDHTVTRANVQAPAWGIWYADVDLVDAVALTGAASLTLADKSLQGTIIAGGPTIEKSAYRIVGGRGGWGKEIKAKPYNDDAGVKLSTIITDAAREVGEVLGALPTGRVGSHYARSAGPASQVLHDLCPQAWYVDFAGVTQFGARPVAAYTGNAPRTHRDPQGQIVELATEEIANLIPGATVDGSLPAVDIEYSLDAKRLTVRAYVGAKPSRRLHAWAKIFDALDPRRKYRACYDFRVVTQSGERLNVQPCFASYGLPDLARVPVRPGMAGLRAQVMLGEIVLLTFVGGDPSRPVVINHDAPDAPGFMPLLLKLGEDPVLGVARQTDPIIAGPFAGTITGPCSVRVKAGL